MGSGTGCLYGKKLAKEECRKSSYESILNKHLYLFVQASEGNKSNRLQLDHELEPWRSQSSRSPELGMLFNLVHSARMQPLGPGYRDSLV